VQHDVEPVTTAKLRWLLSKATGVFGSVPVDELRPEQIAAWRITIPIGHRFEATQALRQVLGRAVVWGILDTNPAKLGVDNPQRRPNEMRPFDNWTDVERLAAALGRRYGPMIVFAAATGLRPASGPHSSTATSTALPAWPTSAEPLRMGESNARRP
jgi:integrase